MSRRRIILRPKDRRSRRRSLRKVDQWMMLLAKLKCWLMNFWIHLNKPTKKSQTNFDSELVSFAEWKLCWTDNIDGRETSSNVVEEEIVAKRKGDALKFEARDFFYSSCKKSSSLSFSFVYLIQVMKTVMRNFLLFCFGEINLA